MAEFASVGVGNAGLATGIIGTALGVLNSGGLNGVLGGGLTRSAGVSDLTSVANTAMNLGNNYVSKEEMRLIQDLAAKDNEISLLKSEQNTEIKIADVYERIMTRVNSDQRAQADWNASQSVANAQMSSAIATNANSISALSNTVDSITKTAVPTSAICSFGGCNCSGSNI